MSDSASDRLHDRGRALEDAFFAKQSADKLRALREAMAAKEAVAGIMSQTGIGDEALVARMVALGARPETLAAFALVPLIHVAWADKVLDAKEREALLIEAEGIGLTADAPARALLDDWLAHRPGPEVFDAWKAWHAEVVSGLDADSRARLNRQLLENAHRIARASGGMFRIGAVSADEHRALSELEAVLG